MRKTETPVVTEGKILRDTENILSFARFAIVFVDGKPTLVDNGARHAEGLPYARLIAVLAPYKRGGKVMLADVLEIGYSRTRPYAEIESGRVREKKNSKNERRISLALRFKQRSRVRSISEEELVSAYPIIVDCMTKIVLECREHWSVKKTWYVDGPGEIERGIYFTFSKQDHVLVRQMLLENVRYLKRKYIGWHSACIRFWIGRYRRSDYSDRQLKGFIGSNKVAELVDRYPDPLYRRVLLSYFPNGTHIRLLLERIFEAFKIDAEKESEFSKIVFSKRSPRLPFFDTMYGYVIGEQPAVHAKGCLVVEICLERSYREDNECPF